MSMRSTKQKAGPFRFVVGQVGYVTAAESTYAVRDSCGKTVVLRHTRTVRREKDERSRLTAVSSLLCNSSHVGLRLSQDVQA